VRILLAVLALSLASGAGAAPLPAPASGPRISVEPESFDFGKTLQNKLVEKVFVIRNIGSDDLVIERVSTTCGCTVAEGYAKLVKPGQTTTMNVQLQTRTYLNRIERKVLVRSNDATRDPLEIKVQATVVAQ
jgi:hypothetical protein